MFGKFLRNTEQSLEIIWDIKEGSAHGGREYCCPDDMGIAMFFTILRKRLFSCIQFMITPPELFLLKGIDKHEHLDDRIALPTSSTAKTNNQSPRTETWGTADHNRQCCGDTVVSELENWSNSISTNESEIRPIISQTYQKEQLFFILIYHWPILSLVWLIRRFQNVFCACTWRKPGSTLNILILSDVTPVSVC